MKKKGLLRGLKAMGRSETLVEAPAVYLPPLVLRVLRQMGFISALDLWCVAHACRRHLALRHLGAVRGPQSRRDEE